MRRIHFFAAPEDVVPLLARFEEQGAVSYTELGNYTAADFPRYASASQLPEPGMCTHESTTASRAYLVMQASGRLRCKPFVGSKGERRWHPANSDNHTSVILRLGGLWKDMMLAGLMDTLHGTLQAQSLMKRFAKALRQEHFGKMGSFWLGVAALENLNRGMRLSMTAEQSPPAYDLKPLN